MERDGYTRNLREIGVQGRALFGSGMTLWNAIGTHEIRDVVLDYRFCCRYDAAAAMLFGRDLVLDCKLCTKLDLSLSRICAFSGTRDWVETWP
jgi:hypothetical protein